MENIVNLEKGKLRLYNLKIAINSYDLRHINYCIGLTGEKKHFEVMTSSDDFSLNERYYMDLNGNEDSILTNKKSARTGRNYWDCYDDYKTEVKFSYDSYQVPKLYKVLGTFIDRQYGQASYEERCKALAELNKFYSRKDFIGKEVFDEHREIIYKGIYLEEIVNKYILELNQLYKILFQDNEELRVFSRKKFDEYYNVKSYNFDNIRKVLLKGKNQSIKVESDLGLTR